MYKGSGYKVSSCDLNTQVSFLDFFQLLFLGKYVKNHVFFMFFG